MDNSDSHGFSGFLVTVIFVTFVIVVLVYDEEGAYWFKTILGIGVVVSILVASMARFMRGERPWRIRRVRNQK